MQNLQAIAQASPSPLKRQSMQPKIKSSKGNKLLPFGYIKREKLTANPPKVRMGNYSGDNKIHQQGTSNSKHPSTTSNSQPPSHAASQASNQPTSNLALNRTVDAPSIKETARISSGSQSTSTQSSINATSSVGISTLRRLFAGVQSESKKLNNFNDSRSTNYGVTKTPIHRHEPNRTIARGEGGGHNPSHIKRIHSKIVVTEDNETDVTCAATTSSTSTDLSEMSAVEVDGTRNNVPGLLRSKVPNTVIREESNTVSCRNDDLFANVIFEGQDHLHDEIFHSISDQSHLNVETLVKEFLVTRQFESSVIDTDGTESDFGDLDEEQYAAKMHSMLMSPSLITKRYQQALNAIEVRNWNQLSFLINANPWLMEMNDVRNDQSLVHSLSLFGGLQNDADYDGSLENTQPLPEQLVQNVIDYVPNVVHKLDIEGNLPLHMAAASGNIIMIRELGHRFSGAASVQNHNGLLPLHLAILSCALFPTGNQSVELILTLFPGAVWVKDNDGNTPVHIAAGTLRGDVGADVIDQLVKGCHALMLRNRALFEEQEASIMTVPTGILPGDLQGDPIFYMAKNNKGETPLTRAIKSLAGRQVVEALLITSGGKLAALDTNSASQNALHLALDTKFHDAAVVLSILKSSPSTATFVDGKGMLPIQLACLNSSQYEIILAIAIIDLPIDLGATEGAIMRNGFGASWWYLLFESDDMNVGVVREILLLCSYPQKVALCLTQAGERHDSRIPATSATPQCKLELRRSLRFFGRFEFVGGEKKNQVFSRYVQKFDAIDYGTHEAPIQDGKKVSLVCYTDAKVYSREAEHLQCSALDTELFEELSHFHVGEIEANVPTGVSIQYCVAAHKSNLSLASVVAGMTNYHGYRSDFTILGRYFGKSRSIMRQIAKALCKLHAKNIIHGQVDSTHMGKFGERWKITGLPGSVVRGEQFVTSRLGLHSPPEAYVLAHSKHSDELNLASLAPSLKAEPTVDIWAFGKLMYEVLVGESLFMVFSERDDCIHASKYILKWNEAHLRKVSTKLSEERIGLMGVDLILRCLCPIKSARIRSMLDILQHPFWRDDKAFNLSSVKCRSNHDIS